MKRPIFLSIFPLMLALLACGTEGIRAAIDPISSIPTQADPILPIDELNRTAYGFFPSPPEATLESVLGHFETLGKHADFVLYQPNVPWEDFYEGIEGESQARTDIRNQIILAERSGLDYVYVVDPLNGLNRREFMDLPQGWEPSFANPDVRTAFTNFTLWILREFNPRYLGLASEINTYFDAHPEDADNYMSLYQDVYQQVKAEAPETQVFITFQWEDLNNLIPFSAEGREAYEINWDQVEAFEPNLDLWVISSYPFVIFESAGKIPADYYTPLLSKTSKPLAVAEGGYSSKPVGPFLGSEEDQVEYLSAIHDQIGERLAFWVYLLLSDFNQSSYSETMREQGRNQENIDTLGMFASVGLMRSDGSPKPALDIWDNFRMEE